MWEPSARTGIEQRRRRTHEVERGQHVVELDRARLAVDLVQSQAHRHAHEKRLRQFDARALDMQEIPVIERLQAEVTELEVARCVQSRAELLQVEIGQALIEKLGADAARDESTADFRTSSAGTPS